MKKGYLLHLLIFTISTFITFETSATESNNFVNRATLQQIKSSNSFKFDPPTKAIRVSRRNLRQANKVRRIQQGMPYGEARKILIQQGWQPNLSDRNGEIPNENSGIKAIYDLGYKEINDCAGSGLGLCKFEFINSKGELLVVLTTSDVELPVFHWFLDPPPKAIRDSRRNPQIATRVRGIQKSMSYREARKILIQQGWQPNVPVSNGGIPNLENSQIKTLYEDRGYYEVKNCSGTGLGLCRFEFVNYKRELLVVSATSLPKLKIFNWFIEKSAE